MAKKIIEIDGKKVGFGTSAAIPVMYNREFTGRDFFGAMNELQTAYAKEDEQELYKLLLVIQEFAYVFAKHYAKTEGKPFDYDYEGWLLQFETFSIMNVANEIMGLWTDEATTQSTAKKKGRKQTGK